jgi:predicted ABC-type sugar transport system permease subunit
VCSSPNTFRGRRLFDLTATELCPSTHVVTSNSSLLAVVGITASISIICVVLLAVVCKQWYVLRRSRWQHQRYSVLS